MFQTDQPTAANALPTPAAAGTPGWFTNGSPGSGVAATILDADFMNMLMMELTNVVTAAGLTPSKTTYNQVITAIRAMTADSARVVGLAGKNNATTPNTQVDFSALSVTVRNPTTGATAVVSNTGTITNNVLTAGPAANGRDTAAAFAASSWVHFYFIWNGTTLATVSSLAAPSVGPALPTGYTSWAYIGAIYYTSSSALLQGNFRGSWWNYQTPITAVGGGTATALTAVPLTTVLPPNALQFKIAVGSLAISTATTGAYSLSLVVQVESGFSALTSGLNGTQQSGTATVSTAGQSAIVSALSQGFNYQMVATTGTGPAVTLTVPGYSVPNGGE